MQCSVCISYIRFVTHVIQIRVATLSKAEVGEITCNIFYFNTPQILSFQCVINMIKANEIVHVLFFMLSL